MDGEIAFNHNTEGLKTNIQ